MKNYNRLLVLLVGLLILSCGDDILNETNRSGVDFSYYKSADGIESGVAGAYETLRHKWRSTTITSMYHAGVDTYTHGRDTHGAAEYGYYDSNLNPSAGGLYNFVWAHYYNGIGRTNVLLQSIEDFERDEMSDELKEIRSGELRFLRGLYYFELVRNFGAIPIVTEPNLTPVTDFSRAPVSDVYDQIISDLSYAEEVLPLSQDDYGRATKGAAAHALATVYLTRGSAVTEDRGQQPSDMENAATYADQVINSGEYALLPDFADLWDFDNQENEEVVFATQFSEVELHNDNSGNTIHLYFHSTYDLKPGMRRTVEYGRPWNHIRPTEFTITELFDPTIDSRFHKTFQSVWYANNPNNLPVWEAEGGFEPDPGLEGEPKISVGDTSIWITNEVLPEDTNFDSLYASRPYYYMPVNRQGLADFFTLKKHLDSHRPSVNSTHGTRDGIEFRLAETYLIAAEAYGRMGNFETAADRLNAVRLRAAYKNGELKGTEYWEVYGQDYADREASTEEDMRVTAADLQNEPSFIDFMLDERARELSGEFKRWMDLVRVEKLVERVREHNPRAAQNIQDYHRLRPIPSNHIDRLDPQPPVEEAQNEGYY